MHDPIWPSGKQLNFDQLNIAFLEAMNDIGRYGSTLYGPLPRTRAEHRKPERVTSEEIADHALSHFLAYLDGEPHDHFKTRKHQLAAVAFNAMLEFQFAGLENECEYCGPVCYRGACHNARVEAGDRYTGKPLKRGCVHFYNYSRGVCIYCEGAMPDSERRK